MTDMHMHILRVIYIFFSVLFRILIARETDLISRKNRIKECMERYAKLIAEEEDIAHMEQEAFKLIATSNFVMNQQGNTQKQFYIKASVLKKSFTIF